MKKPRVQNSKASIAVVAPSFVNPQIELMASATWLRERGYPVTIDAQCARRHLYFAGTHEERAQAFFKHARSTDSSVIWCARGGYGAGRLLPILDQLTKKHGKPSKKLLVGYSDVTALHQYVQTKWGWSTLHATMLAGRDFAKLSEPSRRAILSLVDGEIPARMPWAKLKWMGPKPARAIEADLVGGNLCVLTSMIGTAHALDARGKILFLEDTGEKFYRLDRYLIHLEQSGSLRGVRAIVLGTWSDCDDSPAMGVKKASDLRLENPPLRPLRARVTLKQALESVFGEAGRRLGIPIAYGLPVGHGKDGQNPLALSSRYRLSPDGSLELMRWKWRG